MKLYDSIKNQVGLQLPSFHFLLKTVQNWLQQDWRMEESLDAKGSCIFLLQG